MSELQTTFNVARGTAYITYQQVAIYATSFVYYVLLIRVLNLGQVGEVSLLGATMAIFATLTQIALPLAATRFIAATRGNNSLDSSRVARTSLRITLGIAGPGLLIALLASPFLGATLFKTADSISLLLVTFAAGFLIDLTTLFGAYFLGLGQYASMVYQNLLYVPLSRGIGLALAYKGLGPLGIPLGWAIGALATLLLSLYLWKGKLPHSNSNYPIRPLLGFSIPLFASALITLLQGWGDITILQALVGQFRTTGAYYIVVSSVAFLSILWTPAASALYPSLSSSYQNSGPESVSAKLGVVARLVNLTVLPAGAALAAVASTALTAVYGTTLGDQALPFAILSITIIFTAQSLLLTTTLQATGKTKPILWISLTATIIDLAIVILGARQLGTTAGALGRAVLPLVILLLAWQRLRKELRVPTTNGLAKAAILALVTAGLLSIADYLLIINLHMSPLARIPLLLGTFALSYLATSRAIRVFNPEDFELLEEALPKPVQPILRRLERLLIPQQT